MIASFASDGIVRREQNIEALDALRSGSLDFYAQMRSVYRQYRAKQLGNQSLRACRSLRIISKP